MKQPYIIYMGRDQVVSAPSMDIDPIWRPILDDYNKTRSVARNFSYVGGQNGPKKGCGRSVEEGVASPRNVIFPLMAGFKPLNPPVATPLNKTVKALKINILGVRLRRSARLKEKQGTGGLPPAQQERRKTLRSFSRRSRKAPSKIQVESRI
jgi:hypothetical protein